MKKRISTISNYTFSNYTVGTVLDGEYQGSRPVEMAFGTVTLHEFLTETGKTEEVWGGVVLNRALAEVKPGEHVVITYLGELAPTKDGYRPTRLFEVEVDDEPIALHPKEAA